MLLCTCANISSMAKVIQIRNVPDGSRNHRASAPRWNSTISELGPLRLQLGRMEERLEDNAVALRLLPQIFELFLCSFGGDDVEPGPDTLEADGHLSRDAQGSGQVQIALDLHLDALGLHPHSLRDHLT